MSSACQPRLTAYICMSISVEASLTIRAWDRTHVAGSRIDTNKGSQRKVGQADGQRCAIFSSPFDVVVSFLRFFHRECRNTNSSSSNTSTRGTDSYWNTCIIKSYRLPLVTCAIPTNRGDFAILARPCSLCHLIINFRLLQFQSRLGWMKMV